MNKIAVFISVLLFPLALCSQTNDSIKLIDSAKTINNVIKTESPKVLDSAKTSVANKIVDTTKTSKFEMGISFSPMYCFRTLKSNGDESSDLIKEMRDTLEIPKFGYTAGISIAYKLTEKINIETGAFFSDKGEKTKKYTLERLPYGQEAAQYSYNFHYYYLDIPLKVDYYFLNGKLKAYITAGGAANVLLFQKTTISITHANSTEKTLTKTDNDFNRVNFSVMAGFGLSYPISKKTNLKLEPIYTRSITSIINAPVKGYLYSFGVTVGVVFTPHLNCSSKKMDKNAKN